MNIKEIKAIAKQKGFSLKAKKKEEIVREIQEKEGNIPCYRTEKRYTCPEMNCLWRKDCTK